MEFFKDKIKLIVQLTGGLGNQMFQYAAARSLAERNGGELVLDTMSGFVRDTQYKRHYELDGFPIQARKVRILERLPIWIDRSMNKVFSPVHKPVTKHYYGEFLRETRSDFLPEVYHYQVDQPCWMMGYWQTAKYFAGHETLIQQELSPHIPRENRFYELGCLMRDVNSVALGIRLYEESSNPGHHSSDGQMKSITAINKAARELADRRSNLHFFVFCTHRAPALTQLQLDGNITYVTHDDGFKGSVEGLWLLTQCRHHIMTNSSFYWWGAWLSMKNYPSNESDVYAADNFINRDSVLPQWKLF